jgi:hypothetical protein
MKKSRTLLSWSTQKSNCNIPVKGPYVIFRYNHQPGYQY